MKAKVNETTLISRTGTFGPLQRYFDNCSEMRCKIIYNDCDISVPTNLMVLPYELQFDADNVARPVLPAHHIEAVEIGKCLLSINRATARLSFWLQVQRKLSKRRSCVAQLKEWIQQAENEGAESLSRDIVDEIQYEIEFVEVCCEALKEKDSISNAMAYAANPMRAACEEIRKSTSDLLRWYTFSQKEVFFLYLIDEVRAAPIPHPVRVDASADLLRDIFLPFMNLSVMSATAAGGLEGLATLLGLQDAVTISWREFSAGLVHRMDRNPHTVTAFACLQLRLRKRMNSSESCSSTESELSKDTSSGDHGKGHEKASEIALLKTFYQFIDLTEIHHLRRVSAGGYLAVWTTDWFIEEIKQNLARNAASAFPYEISVGPMDKDEGYDHVKLSSCNRQSFKSAVSRQSTKLRHKMKTHSESTDPMIGKIIEVRAPRAISSKSA